MTAFVTLPKPTPIETTPTAQQFFAGPAIEPISRLILFDPDQWERLIEELADCSFGGQYEKVLRASGSNDRGIDVAGFADAKQLEGIWDNYQCKHYCSTLSPADALPEIGKILWHSFNGAYSAPRAYYFVAPRGASTTLSQLLAHASNLKSHLIAKWDKQVSNKITSTQKIELDGKFAEYVDEFDFSIFDALTPKQIVDLHRLTPYFHSRFGGQLPPRPLPGNPPNSIAPDESKYVSRLFEAYSDHKKVQVASVESLKNWVPITQHFKRQRESFYHAESLRVFVRDKVEPGTFESLQEEVYHGVVNTNDAVHDDGLSRVNAVMKSAQDMSLEAHPLGPSAATRDRHGICHQLANKDRLKWTK
ncbi:MAG: hypothetical protein GW808_02020 [Sphingomonadales bacterium]|nr:hypothetical protein [Sphingomonadales bacterium]NCQ49040.1 hypothetical protein [Sphingomonadales bacterium]